MSLLHASPRRVRKAPWPAIILLSACGQGGNVPAIDHTSPTDLSGVWLAEGSNDVLTSIDGSSPPFTVDAARLYQQHRLAQQAGDTRWDSTQRCIPPGVPRIMLIQKPLEIAQDSNLVSMTFQYQRLVRFIYLNDAYPENPDASFMGTSRGHWEGPVLVVDSSNFKGGTVLDSTGIPHGAKLRLTERIQRRDPDTLSVKMTITDEETFMHPWQAQVALKRQHGVQVQEDVCVERERIHP